MDPARNWLHALSPAVSTAFFSIVAYCHQGTITHRSTWNKQYLWLPVLYAMCPHLYFCQIIMNAILSWDRNKAMRRLNKPAYRHESRLWNLCAVLGMHTRRRIWHDPPATMASGEPEKIQGMIRLYSCQSERLQNRNRYKEEEFKFIKFFFHLLLLCVQSYQIVYASMAYVKRVIRMPNATLGIDHLAGSYAINGALVILANLILHSQPYEWDEDCNKETREARALLSDVDTSNAWIYESFMALALQLIVWTGLQLWHFGRTIAGPTHAWEGKFESAWDLFAKSLFSEAGIMLTVVLLVGTAILVPTIREVTVHGRYGHHWFNRWLRISYQAGAVISRTVLPVVFVSTTGTIWYLAARELIDVRDGITNPWNANWTKPNSEISVVDAFLCLYC